MKYLKMFENFVINEAANTDLEIKSVAKKIFMVLKKYGLSPNYTTDTIEFNSKPNKGYGSIVSVGKNKIEGSEEGVVAVVVHQGGLLSSIKKGGFAGVKENEVGDNVKSSYTGKIDPGFQKALGILYNEIVKQISGDNFEGETSGKTKQGKKIELEGSSGGVEADKYGNFYIYFRKKEAVKKKKM